jgi:hypothetical protein
MTLVPFLFQSFFFLVFVSVLTGSNDGLIRLASIQPNRLVGIIGVHGTSCIESMDMNHTKTLLASCSHDNTVKFWDIAELFDETVDEELDAMAASTAAAIHSAPSATPLDDDESMSDEGDSKAPPAPLFGDHQASGGVMKGNLKKQFFSGLK